MTGPRRPIPGLAFLLCATALAGCRGTDAVVTLNADGSGTIEQTLRGDPGAPSGLGAALAALGGAAPVGDLRADPLDPAWDRAAVSRVAPRRGGVPGLALVQARRTDGEGGSTLRLSWRFRHLHDAVEAGVFAATDVRLEHERLGPRPEDGARWTLELSLSWRCFGDPTRGEIAGRPRAEVVRALAPVLEGLTVSWRVAVPAPVLETNGTLAADGRTVTASVDLAALERPEGARLLVRFADTPDLELEPFRERADPWLVLRRLLAPPPGSVHLVASAADAPADVVPSGAAGAPTGREANGASPPPR